MKLILGSKSPRRRELLAGLNIPFCALNIDIDESYPKDLQGGEIPIYVSRKKAHAYIKKLKEDELLITADTIVWLHNRMLGKPHDNKEAYCMLQELSGQTHQVYTGVTFTYFKNDQVFMSSLVDKTDVTFRTLAHDEIDNYITKYKPLDKAGAYGIQEYIGYIGVTKIVGSYFNVMGLPLEPVYKVLHQFGF